MEEDICKKICDKLKTQGIKPVENQKIVLVNGSLPRQFVVRYKFGTNEFFVEEINPKTSVSVIILNKEGQDLDLVCSGKIELKEPCKV